MPRRDPPPEPLSSNFAELNAAFYNERPWVYFHQRLDHLAAVAADTGATPFPNPISVGPITIEARMDAGDQYPTPGQSFVAVESEVLLHHSAETLLRLIHAHAESNSCPWLRMSSLKSAREFKQWVQALVARPDLPELTRRVFGGYERDPEESEHQAKWGSPYVSVGISPWERWAQPGEFQHRQGDQGAW